MPQAMLNTSPDTPGVSIGEQVPLHDVVDVREVARLLAVAVDLERLALERQLEEARDDRRVLRLRVLARPEDVEVAQAHRLEAVEPREDAAVVLRRELRDRVRRDRVASAASRPWAASGRRRRPTTTTRTRRAGPSPRGRPSAGSSVPPTLTSLRAHRVVDRARHRAQRRLVEDAVDARDGARARRRDRAGRPRPARRLQTAVRFSRRPVEKLSSTRTRSPRRTRPRRRSSR